MATVDVPVPTLVEDLVGRFAERYFWSETKYPIPMLLKRLHRRRLREDVRGVVVAARVV